jgi:hypothetical protein
MGLAINTLAREAWMIGNFQLLLTLEIPEHQANETEIHKNPNPPSSAIRSYFVLPAHNSASSIFLIHPHIHLVVSICACTPTLSSTV